MVNYANGKIYKIEAMNAPPDEKVYVGSTTKPYLSQRMDAHRSAYKRWQEGKIRKVMSFDLFDKFGVENCVIVLLENVNVKTKDELQARERYYITSTNCLNKCIPLRTDADYRTDNKEKISLYYQNNKDKIKTYNKNYAIENKEKQTIYKKKYNEQNAEKIKENKKKYNDNNIEKIKKYKQEYRRQNIELIINNHGEVHDCPCGSTYTKCHKARHDKTKKHNDYIKSMEENKNI
jgi:hypothetical protein